MKRAYMNMLMKMKAERIKSFHNRPAHYDMSGKYLLLIGGRLKPKYNSDRAGEEICGTYDNIQLL